MMEIEYAHFEKFILKCVRKYGRGLDQEECHSEGWRAFLEARETYPSVAGCCDFSAYAEDCLEHCMEEMRQKRNHRISLFSPFSLDTPYYDSNESFLERLPSKTNDCARSVELWDYLERIDAEKREIAYLMIQKVPDWEIMQERCIYPERYYTLLDELREDMRSWLKI